jgi:hypothetical protein
LIFAPHPKPTRMWRVCQRSADRYSLLFGQKHIHVQKRTEFNRLVAYFVQDVISYPLRDMFRVPKTCCNLIAV